ncbi:hypothetical protein DJ030_09845 [bacterium endosymbiont of Escarpia laminata]|nr:MAG: hypothetical protein DJ030_09845 [bacterium endosymbiont of Escarpia laminata]
MPRAIGYACSDPLEKNSAMSVLKMSMFRGERQLLLSSLLSSVLLSAQISAEELLESYLELDLEDLLSMEVTSVSRAVRTPSSVEYGSLNIAFIVPLPPPFPPAEIHAIGNQAFESEVLLAYETGYRIQPRENLSFDLALFYNDYDNIQNFQSLDPLNPLADLQYDNNISAHSYGMELVVDWRALEWWRLQSNYSFIEVSDFAGGILGSGGSPKHQFSLRSMMDLSNNVSLDLWAYYVDELKRPASTVDIPVGEYTSLNARLAWRPQKNLELSLVGQNLLDNHHPEFTGEYLLIQTEVERSAYGLVRVNF